MARQGHTNLLFPAVGRSFTFGSISAGDFFVYRGVLQLKINLTESVCIPSGSSASSGTNVYESGTLVDVVNVDISIRS